jgi:SAM-dependent methyltransferase
MIQAPPRQRPGGPLATEPSRLQRLAAGGYDWLFDRVDPLGGGDHRRLVERAAGEVLEVGAGTGRNLPPYRTATRVVALEPGPGMRARAHQAARAAQVAVVPDACPQPRQGGHRLAAKLQVSGSTGGGAAGPSQGPVNPTPTAL